MHPWNGTDASAPECEVCRTYATHHHPQESHAVSHLDRRLARLEELTRETLSQPVVTAPHVTVQAQPIWSGRPTFGSYAPGILTAVGWTVVWAYVVLQNQAIAWYGTQLLGALGEWLASGDLPGEPSLWSPMLARLATTPLTPPVVQVAGGFLVLSAVWAFWRRVGHALRTSYHLTTDALHLHTGPLSGQETTLALEHLAHIRLRQTLRGRLLGYARCRFVSNQSGVPAMVWRGVPLRQFTTALLQATGRNAQGIATARR